MTNDTPDMTPVTAAPSVYKCNECGKVFDTDDPEKFHCHREPESKCCGMIYPVTTAPDWRGLVEELVGMSDETVPCAIAHQAAHDREDVSKNRSWVELQARARAALEATK